MRDDDRLALAGSRALLDLHRLGAVLAWVFHRPIARIRGWFRLPRLVPGELIVLTMSASAREIVEGLIRRLQRERRFFKITKSTPLAALDRRHDKETSIAAGQKGIWAWRLKVRPGAERAMLLDLELRLATQLARHGGYANVDWRLAVRVARSQMSVHRSRYVYAATPGLIPPGPIAFARPHSDYRAMLGATGDPQPGAVHVAVLDTNINREDLPEGAREKVCVKDPPVSFSAPPADGHGALTVSIIHDLAPNACIALYPVVGFADEADSEAALLEKLIELIGADDPVDLVVMCLSMAAAGGNWWSKRDDQRRTHIEQLLPGMKRRAVVMASTGNSGDLDSTVDVLFPAICHPVVAVGAINLNFDRPQYSKYRFDSARRQPTFIVAPGGTTKTGPESDSPITVDGQAQIGTSIATAYAAGITARLLGETRASGEPTIDEVIETIKNRANRSFDDYPARSHEFGSGIIRHEAS